MTALQRAAMHVGSDLAPVLHGIEGRLNHAGRTFAVSLRPQDAGAVYLHDAEYVGRSENREFTFLAPDFKSFFDGLESAQ